MKSDTDYVALNVPGLITRYSNPSDSWEEIVQTFAETQLRVFRQHGLIKEEASALTVPIREAIVRFSDYTALGQLFVKSGAVDKWLASCDRKRTLSAYQDPKPLERRVIKFLEAQQTVAADRREDAAPSER